MNEGTLSDFEIDSIPSALPSLTESVINCDDTYKLLLQSVFFCMLSKFLQKSNAVSNGSFASSQIAIATVFQNSPLKKNTGKRDKM